ncbi:sigma-E factor negative regulatory protein [Halomonas sp. TRM85114]|uniref:sigma-E factor negative regulatory protein n=1 Tax=Halomonas jincaotanensis TaxID=2810616 RepID=UPI001BD1D80D|nr:sigma-E factor negative regulatory protein [Halomonas jincaotanensis]MBS9402164.1 sigma-E factor negative regulatory protein [Halomonas jincaotanensis]
MSHNARESLSALMDNEGDELELRRVLKSLDDSPDAAETWRRYHLMRSMMRREPGVDVATDLSAGIMTRLDSEQPPARVDLPLPSTRRTIPFGRSAGIAAAVSLMVIGGAQFYNGTGSDGSDPTLAVGGESAQSAPASLASGDGGSVNNSTRPSLVDLPIFQSRSASSSGSQGLRTVGVGQGLGTGGMSSGVNGAFFGTAGLDNPLFMAPSPRQSQRADEEQARLLQSYLDRHAEGSAYRSGDTWMPLLRASGSESLGER